MTVSATRPEVQLPNTGLFIGGGWRDPVDGDSFAVLDPVTEGPIVEVAAGTEADIDLAVRAAREQFDGGDWSRLAGADRGRLLLRLADLIERDAQRFAELEMLDLGQPSFGPWPAIDTFRYFAGWADKINGDCIPVPPMRGQATHVYTLREPVGVVGAITPWNAPLMIAAWKLAPALAAGCTVVLKPPEDAPLSSLHLAGLIEEAEFPAGSVNVVCGLGVDAGAPLVRHPGVEKVSFTGSTAVGHEIGRVAGENFKRLTLELGGKSPNIIFADADLETTIPPAAAGFYLNSGQICAAGTRVLVQRPVIDEVVSGLKDQIATVNVGDPFEPSTTIGALINRSQFDRVLGYIEKGTVEGAELIAGGQRVGDRGYFVEPTMFQGSNDLTISQEEIFGPVATVIGFDDVDEAVRIANSTRYGLAAQLWTSDISKAHLVAAKLRVGGVRVNGGGGLDPQIPRGGFKASGIGRELGYTGIQACTEEKVVAIGL